MAERTYLIFQGWDARNQAEAVVEEINNSMRDSWRGTKTKSWVNLDEYANDAKDTYCIPVDVRIHDIVRRLGLDHLEHGLEVVKSLGMMVRKPSRGGPLIVDVVANESVMRTALAAVSNPSVIKWAAIAAGAAAFAATAYYWIHTLGGVN